MGRDTGGQQRGVLGYGLQISLTSKTPPGIFQLFPPRDSPETPWVPTGYDPWGFCFLWGHRLRSGHADGKAALPGRAGMRCLSSYAVQCRAAANRRFLLPNPSGPVRRASIP